MGSETTLEPGGGYVRVSTEEQRQKQTIKPQLAEVPKKLQQAGFSCDEIYTDDGYSGDTIEGRPAVRRLLTDVERGRWRAIGVTAIDRIYRSRFNRVDWELIKSVFRKADCKLVAQRVYDFSIDMDCFEADLYAGFSGLEVGLIRKRMMAGRKRAAQEGRYTGGNIPYGRIVNAQTKVFETLEDEAAIVRLIFQCVLEGMSTQKIAQYLNEHGYPTRGGKPWAQATVHTIATNPTQKGEYHPFPQQRNFTVALPPIVSPAEFDRAQVALAQRKTWADRNRKRLYLLSGLIICATCQTRMTGETTGARINGDALYERRYYVCGNGRRKQSNIVCPRTWIRADALEQVVWDAVLRLLNNPRMLQDAIQARQRKLSKAESPDALLKLLRRKEDEEDRLLDLYQVGRFSKEKIEERLEKNRRERATIEQNIEALKQRSTLMPQLDALAKMQAELNGDGSSYTFERKQRLLRALFGAKGYGIYVSPGEIDLRGLLDVSGITTTAYAVDSYNSKSSSCSFTVTLSSTLTGISSSRV